jgi:carbonic anhydrase
MCKNCTIVGSSRREFLGLSVIGLAAFASRGSFGRADAAEGSATVLFPEEALAALKGGNERYVRHPELCSVDLAAQRSVVAAHQAPWATVISCADSPAFHPS